MKKLLLFSVLLLAFGYAHAQPKPNLYELRTGTRPYVELTGATVMPQEFVVDTTYRLPLSGQTFKFFGNEYKMNDQDVFFDFTNRGNIRIDDKTHMLIVDGIFTYLDAIDQNSSVSYKVEGTGDNTIVKVQWKNLKIRSGQDGNFANFQIWVHKATGIFEVHYGPGSASNLNGYTANTGPYLGMFYCPLDFQSMTEKLWLMKGPGTYTIDSVKGIAFYPVFGIPAEGTVLRYVPKTVTASVEKHDIPAITLFPNPAITELLISLNKTFGTAAVHITDMQGRVVYSKEFLNLKGQLKIDIRSIPSGMYNVHFKAAAAEATHQVLIQH